MSSWTDGQTTLTASGLNRLPMTFGEKKNVRIASCVVTPGATPTIDNYGFGGFSTSNYTRHAAGDYTLNLDGAFTGAPVCVGIICQAAGGGVWTADIIGISTTAIRVRTYIDAVQSETGLGKIHITVAGQV